MPREVEPSNNEREFVLQTLQQGTRLDGRPLDTTRKINISFGEEPGVADVQLGQTRYIRLFGFPTHRLSTDIGSGSSQPSLLP